MDERNFSILHCGNHDLWSINVDKEKENFIIYLELFELKIKKIYTKEMESSVEGSWKEERESDKCGVGEWILSWGGRW